MIWPVAGIMCVGTICWCATVVLLVVVRACGQCASGLTQPQSFARSELSYKRDVALYARLILYELVALIPACFVVLPFETIRDEILGQDKEIFYNGKLRRHAIWYVRALSARLLIVLIGRLAASRWEPSYRRSYSLSCSVRTHMRGSVRLLTSLRSLTAKAHRLREGPGRTQL